MKRRYFGTDGVRGKVGVRPITPDFVMLLGQAAGRVLCAKKAKTSTERPVVLIGKDTRVSGYMLEAALEAGFSSAGVDVVLCGPIPTPAVAYLTRALRLDAGVVISASHNPYYDNGIKFFSRSGTKLPDSMETEIRQEIDRGFQCVRSAFLGKARRLEDAVGRYIEFCKASVSSRANLKGMRILVDCANGAAYHVAPMVFHELGAHVVTVGAEPNGLNINDGVGATHTEHLSQWVLEHDCDVGISLDGDADRLIMADRYGHVYNGDALLYVMAMEHHRKNPLPGVVGTLMSNYGLEASLKKHGIRLVRAKVGDRYVMEALVEQGWLFGGESSGHLIALHKQTTGDGIVSALQILTAMKNNHKTLQELTADLRMYPQSLVNVHVADRLAWQQNERFMTAVARVEARLGDTGRVLIRPSGTEPLVRVMVECQDAQKAKDYAHALAALLR